MSEATLRRLIARLGAAFHWPPSEIKLLALDDALAYLEEAREMGLLSDV